VKLIIQHVEHAMHNIKSVLYNIIYSKLNIHHNYPVVTIQMHLIIY